MGMVSLPSLEDYWKKDPVFHCLPVADCISYDHFQDISTLLTTILLFLEVPGHNRLGKVQPVIDHLSQRFSDVYGPHCKVAIDKAMIKFQGRSSLKQYMLMKSIKRVIKVWVLRDSHKFHNGYFHKFNIYSGKEGTQEVGLGLRVVKTLTNHLRGKFHHIFFNNFFTSLEGLEADRFYGCGTARNNCIRFPPKLKTMKLTNRYNTFKQITQIAFQFCIQ